MSSVIVEADRARPGALFDVLFDQEDGASRIWMIRSKPRSSDFRIGLHFGPAILSRLGSPTQQQISATGDTVNVASRLLEVAKQQHCRIVVTEDLFQAASATAPLANIDTGLYAPLTVSIRGRASDLPVRIRR